MARWALKAALGQAAGDLATTLRQERERRYAGREAMGVDRYQSMLRAGEMTLRQQLEEQSPEFKARLGLMGAQTEQAQAGTQEHLVRTQGQQAESAAYQRLSPEQQTQLQMVPATQATTSQQQASTLQQRAATDAETEARLQGARPSRSDKPEWVQQAEDELKQTIRTSRTAWDWASVIDRAMDLGLTTEASPLYKDWYSGERKDWIRALIAEKKAGSEQAVTEGAVGLPGVSAPTPPAAGAFPADMGQMSPAQILTGEENVGAEELNVRSYDQPQPQNTTFPTTPIQTSGEARNTAGLSQEEIAYIEQQASRSGLTFDEARRRLDAQLRR